MNCSRCGEDWGDYDCRCVRGEPQDPFVTIILVAVLMCVAVVAWRLF